MFTAVWGLLLLNCIACQCGFGGQCQNAKVNETQKWWNTLNKASGLKTEARSNWACLKPQLPYYYWWILFFKFLAFVLSAPFAGGNDFRYHPKDTFYVDICIKSVQANVLYRYHSSDFHWTTHSLRERRN